MTIFDPSGVPVRHIVDTDTAVAELAALRTAQAVAVDTETVILRDVDGEIIPVDLDVDGPGPWRVMSIAAKDHTGTKTVWVLDMAYIDAAALAPAFAGVRPYAWHAPFDQFVLTRGGLFLPRWWDAMIAHSVLVTGASGGDAKYHLSLAKAARKYLGYEMQGKDSVRLNYQSAQDQPTLSPDEVRYAGLDALITLEIAEKIGALLRASGLTSTFVREANAQPFLTAMVRHGFPLDVPGYQGQIDKAAEQAADAAERLAVLTTGAEMLETLTTWAARTGRELSGDTVADGLALLRHDESARAFIADLEAASHAARVAMGQATGAPAPSSDMFSDEDKMFQPLPFDPDNDTSTRKFLTREVPHFVAHHVLTARDPSFALAASEIGTEELMAAVGRKRSLTVAHDIDTVLDAIADSDSPDVSDSVTTFAAALRTYRRYARILTGYRDAVEVGNVRLRPDWNIGSDVQVRDMLNRYNREQVHAYTQATTGTARDLATGDKVDKDTLRLIGGPLVESLLAYRAAEKIVSTYGASLIDAVNPRTQRVHARYTQALTGTGRLSSSKPNAQNLTPLAKPFIRPQSGRVFVMADLSQAELRFVASAAQDTAMLAAFHSGEDLHERTASLMFHVDMKDLKARGGQQVAEAGIPAEVAPDRAQTCAQLYKSLRGKAKAVSFGYAYGLKGASLGRNLTVNGIPTSPEEATALLDAFDAAYPQVAAWMAARVADINALVESVRTGAAGLDYAASWRLHSIHSRVHATAGRLSNSLGYFPDAATIAAELASEEQVIQSLTDRLGTAPTQEQVQEEKAARVAAVKWALSHDRSAVLTRQGSPWVFESRTAGGRRRLFPVLTGAWTMAIITQVCRSRNRALTSVRDAWVEQHNAAQAVQAEQTQTKAKTVSLTKVKGAATVSLDGRELEKVFEDRNLRTDFVTYFLAHAPQDRIEPVMAAAMADCVRRAANQYRNHPIQGGVADAILDAFDVIETGLREHFPTAVPVQSVHDSIVIECDQADAVAVRDLLTTAMQDALAAYCPGVPCVADGDISVSLADQDILDEAVIASWAAPAAA